MRLMGTREVAKYLDINEKKIYSLISSRGLPGTKVTGKWLFPMHLVDRWLEGHVRNLPVSKGRLDTVKELLIITGSNDILLERLIGLFNSRCPEMLLLYGNLGSMRGLEAMRRDLCHIGCAHLLEPDREEYNFSYVQDLLGEGVAVVNLSRRNQGLLVPRGNPKRVRSVADLADGRLVLANRPAGTGTRILLDKELERHNVDPSRIPGYERSFQTHMEVGLEVLAGRADVGVAIEAVAGLLGLDFVPIRWERFDLLVRKERFFERPIQMLLGLLHDPEFLSMGSTLRGYDLKDSGRIVYPS